VTNVVSLSECCTFIKDGTHGSPARTRVGIPVLSAAHVRDGLLHFDTDRFTSDEELITFQKRLKPAPGDVLLTIVGTIGRTAIIDREKPFVFQRSVCVLRPKKDVVISAYLKSALESDGVKSQFHAEKHEVAQAGIYLEALNEIKIPLPPLSEQVRITALIDKADRLRRTRRYALELTDTFLPAAFLELFGDPTTNPLGLPVAELGDFLSFVTSGSRGWADYYVPKGARFIRSLDVRMNSISDEDAVFVNPPNGAEAERTRVIPGDVLLTITGSRIGRVASVPERLNGAFISQHVAILRLKAGLIPEFLSMFLSLNAGGQRQIARLQYGQSKPGLNLDQIREMRVPVPQISQQQRFLKLVERAKHQRAVQREALRQAEHLLASLLHRAFSS
jgi:type I restriction enzyme S subunit